MIQLTPAQQAYYDLLVTLPGQGTPNEIRAYVAGLNDAQALVSLDVTARASRVIASDPVADQLIRGQDGFTTTAYLAEKYDVEGPLLQGSTGGELVYIEKVSAPNQEPVYEIVEQAIVEPVTATGTPVTPIIVQTAPTTPAATVIPAPVITSPIAPAVPLLPQPVSPVTPLTPIMPVVTQSQGLSNLALYGLGALAYLLLLRR